MTPQEFDTVIRRLRLDDDFNAVINHIEKRLEKRTEELVYRQDTVGTHRLQGSVAELSELLKDLCP